jgi:hypothetical protein
MDDKYNSESSSLETKELEEKPKKTIKKKKPKIAVIIRMRDIVGQYQDYIFEQLVKQKEDISIFVIEHDGWNGFVNATAKQLNQTINWCQKQGVNMEVVSTTTDVAKNTMHAYKANEATNKVMNLVLDSIKGNFTHYLILSPYVIIEPNLITKILKEGDEVKVYPTTGSFGAMLYIPNEKQLTTGDLDELFNEEPKLAKFTLETR